MFASLQQSIASAQPVQHVPKDKVAPASRPWLKVRLSSESLDAVRIVGEWRTERRAASTMVKAILMWDAIERGDIDDMEEICPLLGPALNASAKRRKSKTAPPKTPIQEDPIVEDSKRGGQEVAQTLAEVTGSDLLLNQRAITNLTHKLVRANYTAEDVRTWYTCWWRVHDWRGKKGERPKIKDVQELIGQVRSLTPQSLSGQTGEANPYLQDEYFARHTDADVEPEPQLEEEPQPETTPMPEYHVPGWVQDRWLAAKGQLEVQLNRATFDTWLKHTQPVHFVGDRNGGTLYVSVPHRYAKDWIDKHLRSALNKLFDSLLNYDGQTRRRISQEALFAIEIVVEGGPDPAAS